MLRFPLPFLALVFAAAIVAASHTPAGPCDGGGQPALGIVEVTGGSAETTFYIDDRNYFTGNGLWLYAEANGIWTPKTVAGVFADDVADHDLQRGPWGCEPWSLLCDFDETCRDPSEAGPDLSMW